MLQEANNDIFNLLVPKAHNIECLNLPFSLHNMPVKVALELIGGFFVHPRH